MASESEGESTAATSEEERPESHGGEETTESRGEGERTESRSDEERTESRGEGEATDEDGGAQSTKSQGGAEGESEGEGEAEGGESGGDKASMAGVIEDVSSLPGENISDQDGRKIGQIKEIYAVGDDETPMWVTVETSTGIGRKKDLFLPLARIKKQGDEIRVPYSYAHIQDAPDVESGDELSEEDDRALRSYYAIGLADQELVGSAMSYASQVPDDDGPARKIEGDAAKGPVREIDDTPPAKRVAEAYDKQREEEGDEHRGGRKATAEDVFDEDGSGSGGEDDSDEDEDKKSGEAESNDEPKAEAKQDASSEGSGDSKGSDEGEDGD